MTSIIEQLPQTFAGQVVTAFFGTVAFALLFSVPKRFYVLTGIVGAAGWALYVALVRYADFSTVEATFFATVLVAIMSRIFAVSFRCPVTLFKICGIFPLVPGIGIFWTVYYVVSDRFVDALNSGFLATKLVVAIVLGLAIVGSMPDSLFARLLGRRTN